MAPTCTRGGFISLFVLGIASIALPALGDDGPKKERTDQYGDPLPEGAGVMAHQALFIQSADPSEQAKPARTQAPPAETSRNPERISLTGKVVDANGKPISGAVAYLRECPYSWSSSTIPALRRYEPTKTRDLARTTSDASGQFAFKDVALGKPDREPPTSFPLDLVVTARGHALAWRHLLGPGPLPHLELVLPPENSLRGHVAGSDGKPVRGARMQVVQIARLDQVAMPQTDSPGCIYLHHAQAVPAVVTEDDGSFAIAGLPRDVRVTLRVMHERYLAREVYAATGDQRQLNVSSGPPSGPSFELSQEEVLTGDVAVRLESAGRVRGRVVYEDTGKPVPRAGVGWFRYPPEYAANEEGQFVVPGLTAGKHYFRIYPPKDSGYLGIDTLVDIRAEKSEVEQILKLPRGILVNGRVVDEGTGKGVPAVLISYFGETARKRGAQLLTGLAETEREGRFRITVPPGKGELFVHTVPDDYLGLDVPTGRSITDAGPGYRRAVEASNAKSVADVEFKLSQGQRIAGRVADPTGKPLRGVTIETRDYTGPNSYRGLTRSTNEEGDFLFGGLRNQEYELIFLDRQRNLAARVATVRRDGKEDRLEVSLQPMVKATGRVLDEDGKTVAGAVVRLHQWDRNHGSATGDSARTDAHGFFTIDVLVPGVSYHLEVRAAGHTSIHSPHFTVKPGDTHRLADLTLRKADQSLAGVVVSKTGIPLAGVIVRGETGGVSEARVTDHLGRFRITDLPRGPIQLWAWVPWVTDQSFAPGKFEAGKQDLRIELPAEQKKTP